MNRYRVLLIVATLSMRISTVGSPGTKPMRRCLKPRKTGYGTLRTRASYASSAATPSRKIRD